MLIFILQIAKSQSTSEDILNLNRDKTFRLLFDYYHHNLPQTKVGNLITTGSWLSSDGRYGWDDFVHTNSFDHAYAVLSKEYSILMSRSPFSNKLLKNIDGVVIISADNPNSIPNAKILSDQEINDLISYVEEGGSLMVMLNSSVNDRLNESFEGVQLRKLLHYFGLDWNNVDTHYSDNVLQRGHPYFYDIHNFHYGAGCTINILPNANQPKTLLTVYSDSTYKDRNVKGAGIVMVRPGKGKFILVGDAGSWTGNLSRPWADNTMLLQQLFRYMKPDQKVNSMKFELNKTYSYDVNIAGLQAMPKDNSLSKINLPIYKIYSPRPTTGMPYFEGSSKISLSVNKQNKEIFNQVDISVKDFKWFDQPVKTNKPSKINLSITSQGKVFDIRPTGQTANWLAPDISSLFALLPVDGLQIGDQWSSIEDVRIPNLRSTDIPKVKQRKLEFNYIGDTTILDKEYRIIQSYDEAWLSDWEISVGDLLPNDEIEKLNSNPFNYLHKKGGKILLKRQQYVDKITGLVIEAKVQTRIIVWIQDTRRPVAYGNKEKDEQNIVSMATIIHFKLKES